MLKLLNNKKAQSTLEYAILIVIIVGALLTIQVYIKRGIQGRLKSASDDIGDQFSPGNTRLNATTVTSSQTRDTFNSGVTRQELTAAEQVDVTMNQSIINVEQEYWGADPQTPQP